MAAPQDASGLLFVSVASVGPGLHKIAGARSGSTSPPGSGAPGPRRNRNLLVEAACTAHRHQHRRATLRRNPRHHRLCSAHVRHQSNGQRQSATHRPAAVDCRALLPLNARCEESGVGTRPCMHLHNLPLSDPLLAGAFHFQRCRGRATIPSGGFSARVPPGRRSAFTQCEPRRSSFAALISRQPNQRYVRVVLQKCPRVSGPRAPAVTTQLSRGSFSCTNSTRSRKPRDRLPYAAAAQCSRED